jgi:hypothetical protein
MHSQKKTLGILSKILKNRKKQIIVAENLFGNTLFIPVSVIEQLYTTSMELTKIHFQRKHREALRISVSELERLEQHLTATQRLNTNSDQRETMERLITENLMTSNDIILKYGDQIEVIAQQQMTAVQVIILYHPEYVVTSNNFLPIRGGAKLLEEVTECTRKQFEGVVEGRWKWNLGNWQSRQRAKIISEQPIIPSDTHGESPLTNAVVETEQEVNGEEITSEDSVIQQPTVQTILDPLEQRAILRAKHQDEYRTEMGTMGELEIQRQQSNASDIQQGVSNELTANTSSDDDYFK